MISYYWRCPYCQHNATIRDGDQHTGHTVADLGSSLGPTSLAYNFVRCPNPKCRNTTLNVGLHKLRKALMAAEKARAIEGGFVGDGVLKQWTLLPPSSARPFPDYIPKAILDDYAEACAIRETSPKASATLARRCLQGMIRDFWGIKKDRLKDEIDALQPKIDSNVWEAIDGVRRIGNIGAHMEKDVNFIVEVEPKEAELLISLIESLLEEWYVARHARSERMAGVKAIAEAKEREKKEGKQTETPLTTPAEGNDGSET